MNRRTSKTDLWFALLPKAMPALPGVYSIWAGGKLLYIGQTNNLISRLTSHNRMSAFVYRGATEVRFHVVDGKRARLKMERWLIQKHKPELNSIVETMWYSSYTESVQ